MSLRAKVIVAAVGWLAAVTVLHLWLNTRVLKFESGQESGVRFHVGFLPVT